MSYLFITYDSLRDPVEKQADLLEMAGDAIIKAVGVKTQEELEADEKEKKRIEAAAQRSLNERQGRRIAKVRAQGLPDELAEKVGT